LAKKTGLVVVSLQYRLGAFGWLYRPNSDLHANLGLLDIVAALKWIKAEIGSFGGDSTNITLVGQGSGSVLVTCLLSCPLARPMDYFHKAVCQSGGLCGVLSEPQAEQTAAMFCEALGIPVEELNLAYLQAAPLKVLCDAMCKVQDRLVPSAPHLGAKWGPVACGPLFPKGCAPNHSISSRTAVGVPLLSGFNYNEINLFLHRPGWGFPQELRTQLLADPDSTQVIIDSLAERLRADHTWEVDYDCTTKATQVVASLSERLLNSGASGKDLHAASDLQWLNLQLMVEESFMVPNDRLLSTHHDAAASKTMTFAYRFDQCSPAKGFGACHALELFYITGSHREVPGWAPLTGQGVHVDQLSDAMMTAWGRFAKEGNPGWAPWDPVGRTTRIFDGEGSKICPAGAAEIKAWEGVRQRPCATLPVVGKQVVSPQPLKKSSCCTIA